MSKRNAENMMGIVETKYNHRKLINSLQKYEKLFSANEYNGSGKNAFEIIPGSIPVMISAPHSVNHFRNEKIKNADKLTGGLALLLHELTGCHVIYSSKQANADPNYDSNDNGENAYQTSLEKYINANGIRVLLDLHGASLDNDFALELGTAALKDNNGALVGAEDPSVHGFSFIPRFIKYSFEYFLQDIETEKKSVWKNVKFSAGINNTITKYISSNTSCAAIQLEINRAYRDLLHENEVLVSVFALEYVVKSLGNINWSAKQIETFRLWQSSRHKPQDKVEVMCGEGNAVQANKLVKICSSNGVTEIVRVQKTSKALIDSLDKEVGQNSDLSFKINELIFLTNRLIESLFGREWIEGKEEKSPIRLIPVILYENSKNVYNIGLPKASQIDNVFLSSALYEEKKAQANDYDFVVFNRYSDSRLYLDFSKADYKDNGRVKDADGRGAKKVMIPRYYKRLLGYMDYPFNKIREEEYHGIKLLIKSEVSRILPRLVCSDSGQLCIVEHLDVKGNIERLLFEILSKKQDALLADSYASTETNLCDYLCSLMDACYVKIKGEVFYSLRAEKDLDGSEDLRQTVAMLFQYLGLYEKVEILTVPKKRIVKESFWERTGVWIDRAYVWGLKKIIGKVDYMLRAEWTSETDDKNNVARLSSNIMSLLGVSENDKIYVRFGNKSSTLRVLKNDEFTDYQIGIPAPTRKYLGMNSINDIVLVHRDMKHVFKRHSLAQTFAILGTILTVFQVINSKVWGLILCACSIPLILYFVLNEERIKVK